MIAVVEDAVETAAQPDAAQPDAAKASEKREAKRLLFYLPCSFLI